MATTNYPVGSPLAVKLWARGLWAEITAQTYFTKFVGTSNDSLIVQKTELSKGPGDRITSGLSRLGTGQGVTGDNTLEGNEEALTTYSDNLLIDQLRHAHSVEGKMSEQRVPFNVREESRLSLADWWSTRLEVSMMLSLTGFTGANYNLD